MKTEPLKLKAQCCSCKYWSGDPSGRMPGVEPGVHKKCTKRRLHRRESTEYRHPSDWCDQHEWAKAK